MAHGGGGGGGGGRGEGELYTVSMNWRRVAGGGVAYGRGGGWAHTRGSDAANWDVASCTASCDPLRL
jgi:hypothetical protein